MNTPEPCWAPAFSPQDFWCQVPATETQAVFRHYFTQWGRPLAVRVDNGFPWGNGNDLPVALALWLIGLDVQVYWNDPRRPQQNGKVERSQGTGKRWAEPQCCRDLPELQRHLDEVDEIQRDRFPVADGWSRRDLFPELEHSGRAYAPTAEGMLWSLTRVTDYLKEFVVPRRVRASGHISMYEQDYYVGTAYRGQVLLAQYDPSDGTWVICDAEGRQLRRHAAREIKAEKIVNLQLYERGRA
jgi:hypothetical protein